MHKVIHKDKVKEALQAKGWSQKELAEQLGVTPQAVTNWFKGTDFPRPDKLLKLATLLKLGFSDLVQLPVADQPVIAFRKKGSSKTTDEHILNAMAMGALLKPLVAFLPEQSSFRVQLASTSTEYVALQTLVAQVRGRLGVGEQAVLHYEHLLSEFQTNGAVVVPVMWGEKQNHKNALHILLPSEKVTFIFLNLDTRLEDFKFWMAHELAHVYTPELAGQEQGEDFADAFAGALLFPRALAAQAHQVAMQQRTASAQAKVLQRIADEHSISLFSVFAETNRYARATGLPVLKSSETEIHALRNTRRGHLVSEGLFDPMPPEPAAYVAATQNVFRSGFFTSLQRMIKNKNTGAGYIQQVMDIPMQDAIALHGELLR
jgi:transcriptional regulator with XRE-family HTH domain